MKIYIVDDSASQRLMLTSVLKAAGYDDLLLATSAREALTALGLERDEPAAQTVDLILMDISMPDINGIDACRQLKAHPDTRDIPIIIVTASSEADDLNQAFDAGAIDYITKPLNKIELLARVRSALRLKRETDQRKAHQRELHELTEYLEAANQILWQEQAKSALLLRTLYEVGQTINSSVELDDTFAYMIRSIKSIMVYHTAEICLYDHERNEMISHVRDVYATDTLEQSSQTYDMSLGSLALLINKRSSHLIADLAQFTEARLEQDTRWASIEPRAYIGVPLLANDSILGTIEMVSQQPHCFTREHLRFLESIAVQAAAVVQNRQRIQHRERQIKQQISELNIEIDSGKLNRQVEEIVTSDFFKALSEKAKSIRQRAQSAEADPS